MNRFLAAATKTVRSAFTTDAATNRFLEKTYVDVSLNSRLWGI
jgi:hypothetical protein